MSASCLSALARPRGRAGVPVVFRTNMIFVSFLELGICQSSGEHASSCASCDDRRHEAAAAQRTRGSPPCVTSPSVCGGGFRKHWSPLLCSYTREHDWGIGTSRPSQLTAACAHGLSCHQDARPLTVQVSHRSDDCIEATKLGSGAPDRGCRSADPGRHQQSRQVCAEVQQSSRTRLHVLTQVCRQTAFGLRGWPRAVQATRSWPVSAAVRERA